MRRASKRLGVLPRLIGLQTAEGGGLDIPFWLKTERIIMTKKILHAGSMFAVVCCLLVQTVQATVYRPGLFQGKYGCTSSAYPNWNQNLRSLAANMTDRTLGSIMADTTSSSSNAVSGVVWDWTGDNMTYGYEGYIWLDSGKTYQIWECNDDGAALRLDGTFMLSNSVATVSGYNEGVRKSTMSVATSGWHHVEMWSYDWSGGAGPVLSKSGSSTMGLAWNTNGSTTVNATTTSDGTWTRFRDSGTMRFLKTATTESFTALGIVSAQSGDLVASMTFNVPTNAILSVLYGDDNAGMINPQAWDHQVSLQTIVPGNVTSNVTVSGLGLDAQPYVCFYLRSVETNSPTAVFEEWTTPFQASGSPDSTVAVETNSFTSASLTVTASSFGLGGHSLDLSVELATDMSFTSIFKTVSVTNGISALPVSVPGVSVTGLQTNTVYYVRAKAVNDQATAGYSAVVSFTTLSPTVGSQFGLLLSKGFDYGVIQYSLTGFGDGSTNAWVYLDLSTNANFSSVLSFGPTNILGTLPASGLITATGLQNGTRYYARIRSVNSWGLTGLSSSFSFETRNEPYAVSAINCTVVDGGTRISQSVTELVTNVTVNATLMVGTTDENSSVLQNWNSIAAVPAELTALFPAASGTYVAKYVFSADFGGKTYSTTNTQAFTVGRNVYAVASLSDLGSLRPKVGETVRLPVLTSVYDTYLVLNSRVAKLDGSGLSVTALAAGGTGIELWSYNSSIQSNLLTTTGSMIVVPEPVGAGKVFVFKETPNANWTDASRWECVTQPSYVGYPQNRDDVAMVLLATNTSLRLSVGDATTRTNTIGELYVGQLRNVAADIRLQGYLATTGTLCFARSTTNAAAIMLTGGANNSRSFTLNLGHESSTAYRLGVDVSSDLIIDAGYCFVDSTWQRNKVQWDHATAHIPEGRSVRFINGHPYDSGSIASWLPLNSNCILTGSGTLWNDSAMTINLYPDLSAFRGTVRDTGYGHSSYDRNANIQLFVNKGTNVTLELSGFQSTDWNIYTSAGFAASGINHGWGEPGSNPGNLIPKAGVMLKGGFLYLRPDNSSWLGPLTNQTDRLMIGRGLSRLQIDKRDDVANPINTFTANVITQQNCGTLYLMDQRMMTGVDTNRALTTFGNFKQVAIGGSGSLASLTYPVVPWVSCRLGNTTEIGFLAANESNIVTRPTLVATNLNDYVDTQDNAYVFNKSITLTEDKTVNSLILRNENYASSGTANQSLGYGRTLTITSGGLILDYGNTSIGRSDSITNAGNLVFGNTAYVYATGTAASPNQIYASITAPHGLVCAHTGTLVLAGNQTGIDGEIVVNNGTLYLGKIDGTVKAEIDADVRIVSQNAKVQVTASGTLNKSNIRFDDVYDFCGKLVLPAGKVEICKKLFIEDWENSLPRGTYGATGSGADNIDDVHFSGTGVLFVTQDTAIVPMVILVR